MKEKKLIRKTRILPTIMTSIFMTLINTKSVLATTIGTQEVETATQNIKDAVVKLAMPIRNGSYVCKYCNHCYQINC